LWDTETAGQLTRPLIGADTRVITVQNGVDSVERLAPILGADTVIGGATYIVTTIAAPGVIRHGGKSARIVCGRLDGRADPLLERYGQEMQVAGTQIEVTRAMALELWKKFVLLSGTSSITAGTRMPFGAVLADADIRALFLTLMGEAVAVARAAGVALPPDYADQALRIAEGFPPEMRASMANDLERGHRLELDWLAGKVSALGRDQRIPTPANDAVYALLKPYRMGKIV
jgi:2-dehydropantoate 2-reductase